MAATVLKPEDVRKQYRYDPDLGRIVTLAGMFPKSFTDSSSGHLYIPLGDRVVSMARATWVAYHNKRLSDKTIIGYRNRNKHDLYPRNLYRKGIDV